VKLNIYSRATSSSGHVVGMSLFINKYCRDAVAMVVISYYWFAALLV
jgi:hypothetical protein